MNQSRLYIQSLATGLSVLRAFDYRHPSMSLPEIAEAVSITKSAAQRISFTLLKLGLLKKDEKTKRYSLAPSVLDTTCHYLESHPLVDRANAVLLELNRETGETVNLAEPSGLDMIYVCRFPSPLRLLVHMPIGRRIPMFCSSSGRIWLASQSPEVVRQVLSSSALIKYTDHTVTDMEALIAEIDQAQHRQFACCVNEYYPGDLALAVPVYGENSVVASLQLSVPSAKWTAQNAIEHFVPKLQASASLMRRTSPDPFRGSRKDPEANRPWDQQAAPFGTD